ncbi:sugar phosphate isomerase/epimerase [Chryseolinea sp. H1M3-3]|uniref:sugar phosphate isomerase/epimerase family protein n=1 Tax=Chryseolinea sp. H1M3-3 TaxID=3034144 RepID=UPI0023ED6AFE|nr:sugar phosphate isomerase/epimerase [Chryseolinea sp. H1M3-3]
MKTRRDFLKITGGLAVGALLLPNFSKGEKLKKVGIQLYSVRKEMLTDAVGTLKQLAKIGYKELESARSEKGNYYGLQPKEIKKISSDLGMTLRSGHVHIDKDFQRSIDGAAEAGQSYLVCSSLPSKGQTIDNYKKVAEAFTKAAEDCKKSNIIFGYHNHEYEFERENGQVLYDILLDNTDPKLVTMELDLGWVVASGNDPLAYFNKYPGRFSLWHLKDMDTTKKESTEFGKGQIKVLDMLKNSKKSGVKHIFVEQEEYASTAMESMKYDFDYLQKLNY